MNRYPGIRPFRQDERHLFFGRNADAERLLRLVRNEQVVVLYGKSGYGKSSLLNAGLYPRLDEEGRYRHWEIRFGPYKPGESAAPADMLCNAVTVPSAGGETLFPEKTFGRNLWQALKNQQAIGDSSRFILFFDQFEELFTYPPEQVLAFRRQLAEALYNATPEAAIRAFEQSNNLPAGTENLLYAPFDLKVVFSIRADRMSLLKQLEDYLPNLLRHSFLLEALDEKQAADAVLLPAGLPQFPEGSSSGQSQVVGRKSSVVSFSTPPFSYAPETLAAIFRALRDDSGRIETSALQIVCKHVEDNIVAKRQTADGRRQTVDGGRSHIQSTNQPINQSTNQPITITPADLGDLKAVFRAFYDNTIAALPPDEQRPARHLAEDVLLKDGIRLPFAEQALLAEPGVSAALLEKLERASLLRVELDEQRRKIYEIGHDTLVGPIEEAAKARREAEAQEKERERLRLEAERQAAEKRKIEAARRRNILVGLSALALLLFAFWKNYEAEEMTRLAQENKEKADQKEYDANRAQARADLLLDSVNVAKTRIDQAEKKLKLAENATEAQKRLARKNLLEAEQAGVIVVRFILENAHQQIKTLDYEKADTALQSAVSLVSGRPAASPLGALRPLVAEALAEPAFFFHETGQHDRADRLAADIARLLDASAATFDKISKLSALAAAMQRLRERYYGNFAEIPGGQFELYDYDSSAHYTAILPPYRMATTETTWWQYHLFCKVTGYPMPEKPGWGSDGDNPVVNVSWYDAVVYCNWRSDREGLDEVYDIDSMGGYENQSNWTVEIKDDKNGYRLPTEAEWQYAATNAGRDAFEYAGSDNLDEVSWYNANSGSRTRPVMGKKPNALGLYDLSGNVWEWCWDWYGEYPDGEQKNYRGTNSGSSRVLRGGSWYLNDDLCSVRWRLNDNPGYRNLSYGFRLAQDK